MSQSTFQPPVEGDYNEYYGNYVSKFQPEDYLTGLSKQLDEVKEFAQQIPEGEDSKPHAPYTWTLKQVMGHLIDCERIFSTRALRIAVADKTPIPGMDQDIYVANLNYENVSMKELTDEFIHLREANIRLAKRMTAENLAQMGTASDFPITSNANFYILGGHVAYHLEIMRSRIQGLQQPA